MRRRERRVDEPAHQDRWLVSYADFITLLFAFFVTMYAISTVDARKLAQAVSGLQVAFAADAPPVPVPNVLESAGRPGLASHSVVDGITLVETRLFYRLRALGEDRVELARDRRGLVVSVKEAGSFDTGKADLTADARELFGRIGGALKDVSNAIRVEGHTDDVPIHTGRYSSNWELSTARATNVVSFFIQEVGLRAGQLSAAGYAEFHPREANDSPGHRAKNRRVDIVVLNAHTTVEEEPLVGRVRGR